MMRGAAACLLAALAAAPCAEPASAQGMILGIEFNSSNPHPVRPTAPVNSLRELSIALLGCWSPPSVQSIGSPVDVTFQVSFKRTGELFGKPRAVLFAREVSEREREIYYRVVAEALDRCAQIPFTDSMGGAIAGRTLRVNFKDRRNSKGAGLRWPTDRS